jgi:hypothetical protein
VVGGVSVGEGGRKLRFICVRADLLDYLKFSHTFVIQLVGGSCGLEVAATWPNEVADFEDWWGRTGLVGIFGLEALRVLDFCLKVLIKFRHSIPDIQDFCRRWGLSRCGNQGHLRVISVVREKWCHTGGCGDGIVRELGLRKKFYPVVLLVVAVSTEILFHDCVYSFGLPMS